MQVREENGQSPWLRRVRLRTRPSLPLPGPLYTDQPHTCVKRAELTASWGKKISGEKEKEIKNPAKINIFLLKKEDY